MGARFTNPWPHPRHGIADILLWKSGLAPREQADLPGAPDTPAPRVDLPAQAVSSPPESGWCVVWLGHASFLLQGCGVSLLIDPVFSEHCAPLRLPSLRRAVAPPCTTKDLPPIDAVLLTHSHYDHLDLPTLRTLGVGMKLFVPPGHAAWLSRKGFRDVTELPWHRSAVFRGLRLTATPAQHFTARSLFDRDRAHWCGWRIDSGQGALWHAGDTGYCPVFREIGERYGPVDFGMIPIGCYRPRRIMRGMHLDPREAVEVFVETRCRRATGMHWGTFRLTDEAFGEPPLLLKEALREKGVSASDFRAGTVGEQVEVPPSPLT